MRISKPRREMYKQSMRSLVAARPKISNVQLANELGLHRNTVARLLGEIKTERAQWVDERWKMLLNDITEIAQYRRGELNKLWADTYWRSKPSQLVAIAKMNWTIQKDLYRYHLEYMGIRENPKTMVQVNFPFKLQH